MFNKKVFLILIALFCNTYASEDLIEIPFGLLSNGLIKEMQKCVYDSAQQAIAAGWVFDLNNTFTRGELALCSGWGVNNVCEWYYVIMTGISYEKNGQVYWGVIGESGVPAEFLGKMGPARKKIKITGE